MSSTDFSLCWLQQIRRSGGERDVSTCGLLSFSPGFNRVRKGLLQFRNRFNGSLMVELFVRRYALQSRDEENR
jgi:hypothetical protein